MQKLIYAAAALLGACTASGEQKEEPAMPDEIEAAAPVTAKDHEALLASGDARIAANKRLVYDMYRIVLQAGLADRAGEFIAADYIQHNPNAAQGLAGLQDYVRDTRPERAIKPALDMPLITMVAEGDRVMFAFVRPEKDATGATYYSTWFDLYRIEDGKIAEHWDPMLKSDARIDPNTQKI